MGKLDGTVALITGGARGQGAAEGRLFVEEGATVYLTDVLTDEGAKTAAEIGGTFIEHDVTDDVINSGEPLQTFVTGSIFAAPEPSAIALLGIGLVALASRRRR